jgi:hypothetical protein
MKTFVPFLVGMGFGYGVATLFAPLPGYRMRAQIKARAAQGADYVKKSSGDLRDQAIEIARKGSDMITKSSEVISNQANAVAEGWEAGRRAYSRRVNA